MTKQTVWHLKKGSDRRFRAGHPWVYANEILESPQGHIPGEAVELHDPSGKFIARGYGNPHSLIIFRALTRNIEELEPLSRENLKKRLATAVKLRAQLGLSRVSRRVVFGEADGLPGLIVDAFVLAVSGAVVLSVQAHTAGIDRVLGSIIELLEENATAWFGVVPAKLGVIVHHEITAREREGLKKEPAKVLRAIEGVALDPVAFLVRGAQGGTLALTADLVQGQKTGFFLDQTDNIAQVARVLCDAVKADSHIRKQADASCKLPVFRILDLFCYVGQWGAQLAIALKAAAPDREIEITVADGSERALNLAIKNIEALGVKCKAVQADIIKGLSLESASYDCVISDPPALVKTRKDMGPGTHAYLQLHTQVMKWVKPVNGHVIVCSCSALLAEDDFLQTLAKATARNQVEVAWVSRGGPALDHPMRAAFVEGRYLKMLHGVTVTP